MIRGSPILLLLAIGLMPVAAGAQEEDLSAGTTAPDFQLPKAMGEGQVSLHEALGRGVVIVHFWKSK